MSSGSWWYGCARGKRAIVPKREGPRRFGGQRFLLTRSIWAILGGRRSKVYHKIRRSGRRYFMLFELFLNSEYGKSQRKTREKTGHFWNLWRGSSKGRFSGSLKCSVQSGLHLSTRHFQGSHARQVVTPMLPSDFIWRILLRTPVKMPLFLFYFYYRPAIQFLKSSGADKDSDKIRRRSASWLL